MKQLLRLTENDLIKVIKKLLKEESTPPSTQYYSYDGVEYKRNINGQWFYWEPGYKKWNDVYGGASVNGRLVYDEITLEKMWTERSPYLKLSNPEKAEKTQLKKTIYQTYKLPKSKETQPTKKLITPIDVALGNATEEDYNINYEAPAIGPDGCQVGYEVVSQEEVENSKNKVIKPWDDTRTGPSNYKKINGKICKKIYPELPEITLSSVMEAIREFLNGTAGTLATTILNLTGLGTLALEVLYAILSIYDYSNKDWLNFILDFINLLTGGTVLKGLGSVTKNIGKVSSTKEALSKLKSMPKFNSIIGTIIDAIEGGLNFIKPFLTKASSFIDKLFNSEWATKAIRAIFDFGDEFIKNFTQSEIKTFAAQQTYNLTTNESIRRVTRKVLLEYSRQHKNSVIFR